VKITGLLVGYLFMLIMAVAAIMAVENGKRSGAGEIALADSKLEVGQVYECVTSLVNINEKGWYAIVKIEEKYLGLRFNEQPPTKGIVVKQEGKIAFLPLATSGINIPNPLAEKPATK